MSEETYELRLEPEGFQIIPVGPDQLAVHSVDGGHGGEQIVTILPDSLVQQGGHGQESNHKDIQQTLFLSADDSHNLVTSGVQFIENQKIEVEDTQENENLVIQYGETWFQDFLVNLQGIGNSLMDFPVFCCDGIFWTNKLILASLGNFLTDFLEEDSCIILPDLLTSEFRTFHGYLFSNRNLSQSEMVDVCKTGAIFGFQLFPGLQYESQSSEVDYQEIFKNQQEEYFRKVYGHAEVANHVMRVAEKPKKPKVSMFLNEFLFNDKEHVQIVTCEDCGRRFEDKELLKSHTETVHTRSEKPLIKPFPCKFCPKTFSYLLNVRRHIFLVHPNAKERSEGQTTYNFNTSHGDSEPDVGLPQEYNRADQIQTKPDFPELEKFKCKICGEFLKSKRYLVAHIQSHYGGGYKCDFPGCSSVFRENAKLNRHKLVHTGVKAFKCDYCHQTFSLRHNLKMHEKTHTRTDLQKCRFCSYETIQKSNMRLHEATHAKSPGKVKGRPAGKQSKGISKVVEDQEKMEMGKTEGNNEETPDEIEQFIAEMEKDQAI
eukprot:GFUD01003615.1.p1 GENE.GFUD01003615.1~~GFUD01003615.1.p1  ORF type:complete len:544 (+),score=155.34 GFUD01003615.1:41-1672(+)